MPSVVMTCPACGEAVRVTGAEDTRARCRACEVDVEVPDEVREALRSPESARILPDETGRLSPSPGRAPAPAPEATRAPSRLNRVVVLPVAFALLGSAVVSAVALQTGLAALLGDPGSAARLAVFPLSFAPLLAFFVFVGWRSWRRVTAGAGDAAAR